MTEFLRKFVGSIDQGTTSTRFVIFNHDGDLVAMHQMEHKQHYEKQGWVEHDADEILSNVKEVVRVALAKAGLTRDDLAAVGITNQRETTVVWDKRTGKPYHNAIVWMDTRTRELCNELSKGEHGRSRFQSSTGLPISHYFSGTKLRWLLDNVPGVKEDAEAGHAIFGTIDSWLLWNLSGGEHHLTDVTNASRTMLMNLESLQWDEEILEAMQVPSSMLPKIVSSSEVYFEANITELLGVPIGSAIGDQQAALFGQACYDVGDAKCTYGTGCFLLLNTGEKPVVSTHGLLTTVAYKVGDQPAAYALEGSVAIAGAGVQWLRDNLNLIADAPEVEEMAKKAEDNGGVYFVPAFSGLFAPHWRDDARGAIVGLTGYSNKNHLCRATLEATAFQSADLFKAMKKDAKLDLNQIRVDGGMVVNDFLMQFQADILNVPVLRPRTLETTALGAAYAAGLAVGYWNDQDELKSKWSVCHKWESTMEDETRSKLFRGWEKAIARTLDWVDEDSPN